MSAARVVELVQRIRREGWSRNRDFDGFAREALGARALRIDRWLRSLERDVARGGDAVTVTVEATPHGKRVTLDVPALHARRVAELSDGEYAILCAHPVAGALLLRAESAG